LSCAIAIHPNTSAWRYANAVFGHRKLALRLRNQSAQFKALGDRQALEHQLLLGFGLLLLHERDIDPRRFVQLTG
jgi:hypothetical protein